MRKLLFKHDKDKELFNRIHPALMMVVGDICWEFNKEDYDCTITSTIRTYEENMKLGSKSLTHVEGRAVDIRVLGIDVFFLDELMKKLNEKYKDISALGMATGTPRLIVWHNSGHGDHWHIQIRRNL